LGSMTFSSRFGVHEAFGLDCAFTEDDVFDVFVFFSFLDCLDFFVQIHQDEYTYCVINMLEVIFFNNVVIFCRG